MADSDYSPVLSPEEEELGQRRFLAASPLIPGVGRAGVSAPPNMPAQQPSAPEGFAPVTPSVAPPAPPQWQDYAPVQPKSKAGRIGMDIADVASLGHVPAFREAMAQRNFENATAAHNMEFNEGLQARQEQRAAETAQSEEQLREAQAGALKGTHPVFDPNTGQIAYLGDKDYAAYLNAQTRAGATEGAAATRAGATTGAAKINADERLEAVKQQGQQAMDRLEKSDVFKQWQTEQDNRTKEDIARIAASKAPAALTSMAEYARGGLTSLDTASDLMDQLESEGAMGESWAQNKIEDWIFGKGAVDPTLPPEVRQQIGQLRMALQLASGALTRAHSGRSAGQMYEDISRMMGPGQDWNALRGTIDAVNKTLTGYADAATPQNINSLQTPVNPSVPGTPPAGGDPLAGAIANYQQSKKGK